MFQNIAIFGSSGAIGHAIVNEIIMRHPTATVHACTRSLHSNLPSSVHHHQLDYTDESQLETMALTLTKDQPLDCVVIATGILHTDTLQPEKTMRQISKETLDTVFTINTIIPTLIAKHMLPVMTNRSRSVFAALSARVGSISDNRLGGWYAYRASKSALNMIIKTLAIEQRRRSPQSIVVGLHPGTVDSPLSKPFQTHVPPDRLFTPTYSAQQLVSVIDQLSTDDSGSCIAWDGTHITP